MCECDCNHWLVISEKSILIISLSACYYLELDSAITTLVCLISVATLIPNYPHYFFLSYFEVFHYNF